MPKNSDQAHNLVAPPEIVRPLPLPEPNWQLPRLPLPPWRFFVPLLLQIVLIASVPAKAYHTYLTGKTVVLQTVPIDPYDLLRGYYQTLSYDISTKNNLEKVSGWQTLPGYNNCSYKSDKSKCLPSDYNVKSGTEFYVILEGVTQTSQGRPQPWKMVKIAAERPTNLPTNQIAIKGTYQGWQAIYGLETYYMPETEKDTLNEAIAKLQTNRTDRTKPLPFVVEVKVGADGYAIPLSLWIGDRQYQF